MSKFLKSLTFASALLASAAMGGEFERIEGDLLPRLLKGEGVKTRPSLNFKDLEALPPALADSRLPFFVVKTGQGNYARVIATPALRKPAEGAKDAIPVLVLDRYDTFEPGKSGSRLAKGVNVLLFDHFQIDLDSGQIVPPGQGGDLEVIKEGDSGLTLKPLGDSTITTFASPIKRPADSSGPSPGKAILPGDFAGRYKLHADGRWTGLLELQVGDDRQISGRFRSESNGTTYPVNGQIAADSPHKAHFTIKFPRTEQEYDAYLWTQGKNVLAGSFIMTERTFGFFAIREGTEVTPLQ